MAHRPRSAAEHIAEIAARVAARAMEPAAETKPEREWQHAKRDRHEVGGNGGPLLEPVGPDLRFGAREVLKVAELMLGSRCTTSAALLLGENPRQVRRWRSGDAEPPRAARHWLVMECRTRIAELQAAVEELARLDPPPPPPEPPAPTAPQRQPCDPRQVDLEDWLDATKP
ncbi:hypothetical protein ASF49_08255 [Methylobacterium sp. Leaf104]|uniref:hypothetical protein n=1 Tax=Methylobacterium TaxID=407 RepID=UPI00070199B3|nr:MULTISPECIES: hypothetical protein [Methylobacterium]KQP33849.1 hypothetical protein ASF49_08255 [Methylobacterium sp. Leaf104]MCI9879581.1 hypothetical protein [Methylobacterium goesingense]